MSNSQWHADQSAPYRVSAVIEEPTGHPVVDQTSAVVLTPDSEVVVYQKLCGDWHGKTGQVVVWCSKTHLEFTDKQFRMGRTVVEWGPHWRWLAA